MDFTKGNQFEIYIGLKDKDSYEELITAGEFKEMLGEVCKDKQIGFSLLTQHGGYAHNKGYTTETSFRIIVIGANEGDMEKLALMLKEKINTDAVLITRSDIEYKFI